MTSSRPLTPPSTLTLIGLLKHLTRVERSSLQEDLLGPDTISIPHPADEWRFEPGETCERVIQDSVAAIHESDRIVARTPLDMVLADVHPLQQGVTLSWALFHMIEETARHVGHADIICESIDGAVGQNRWHF